jgi:tRNA-binding protein
MYADFRHFANLDIRVGTILQAAPFPEARKPAYKLTIDFGELGIRRSSAQLTDLYSADDLRGKQVIAVVNFPPKQIANFMSDCLVLGAIRPDGGVVLLAMERSVENGMRIA